MPVCQPVGEAADLKSSTSPGIRVPFTLAPFLPCSEACLGRRMPRQAYSQTMRPEQSNACGPAAPQRYGFPRAWRMARPSLAITSFPLPAGLAAAAGQGCTAKNSRARHAAMKALRPVIKGMANGSSAASMAVSVAVFAGAGVFCPLCNAVLPDGFGDGFGDVFLHSACLAPCVSSCAAGMTAGRA